MAIYLIVLLNFLSHVGFGGSRVAVSLYAIELGATPFLVGTIAALYGIFPALLAIAAGKIMDRLGFRIPMLFGCSGIMAALLLPYFLPALGTLYATATLLGLSFMVFQLSSQTLAGAVASGKDRARNYSLVSLGFAAASLVGPLIAGFAIDHYGHVRAFLLLSLPVAPAIAIALISRRWIPEVQVKSDRREPSSVLDLLKVPKLRNTFIASGVISSAWDLYQFFLPVYGHSLGLSASAIGGVLSTFASAVVLVRVVLPFVIRHSSETRLLTYSMFVACAAYCLFPFLGSAWTLAATSFLLGIGCGCGQPLSMTLIYNLSPAGRSGEATGVRITVNNLTHVVIPLVFGGLGSIFGFVPVFAANALLLFGAGVVSRRSEE